MASTIRASRPQQVVRELAPVGGPLCTGCCRHQISSRPRSGQPTGAGRHSPCRAAAVDSHSQPDAGVCLDRVQRSATVVCEPAYAEGNCRDGIEHRVILGDRVLGTGQWLPRRPGSFLRPGLRSFGMERSGRFQPACFEILRLALTIPCTCILGAFH